VGRLNISPGERVYIDANVFIAAFEQLDLSAKAAAQLIRSIDAGTLSGVTSELTLAECLGGPLRRGDTAAVAAYERAIATRPNWIVQPVNREILVRAASLRVETGLKLPDAIHLATAILANCGVIVSNDARMKVLPSLGIVKIELDQPL
jgi:predicted nucleic acid-binding protein